MMRFLTLSCVVCGNLSGQRTVLSPSEPILRQLDLLYPVQADLKSV